MYTCNWTDIQAQVDIMKLGSQQHSQSSAADYWLKYFIATVYLVAQELLKLLPIMPHFNMGCMQLCKMN